MPNIRSYCNYTEPTVTQLKFLLPRENILGSTESHPGGCLPSFAVMSSVFLLVCLNDGSEKDVLTAQEARNRNKTVPLYADLPAHTTVTTTSLHSNISNFPIRIPRNSHSLRKKLTRI
ncbi:hypothetical protein ABW19_dt0206122 [Dactylella cylindrospora]|nr:hypothetical protein ABW19_dt0206122 [Dactylella cylindrospora]